MATDIDFALDTGDPSLSQLTLSPYLKLIGEIDINSLILQLFPILFDGTVMPFFSAILEQATAPAVFADLLHRHKDLNVNNAREAFCTLIGYFKVQKADMWKIQRKRVEAYYLRLLPAIYEAITGQDYKAPTGKDVSWAAPTIWVPLSAGSLLCQEPSGRLLERFNNSRDMVRADHEKGGNKKKQKGKGKKKGMGMGVPELPATFDSSVLELDETGPIPPKDNVVMDIIEDQREPTVRKKDPLSFPTVARSAELEGDEGMVETVQAQESTGENSLPDYVRTTSADDITKLGLIGNYATSILELLDGMAGMNFGGGEDVNNDSSVANADDALTPRGRLAVLPAAPGGLAPVITARDGEGEVGDVAMGDVELEAGEDFVAPSEGGSGSAQSLPASVLPIVALLLDETRRLARDSRHLAEGNRRMAELTKRLSGLKLDGASAENDTHTGEDHPEGRRPSPATTSEDDEEESDGDFHEPRLATNPSDPLNLRLIVASDLLNHLSVMRKKVKRWRDRLDVIMLPDSNPDKAAGELPGREADYKKICNEIDNWSPHVTRRLPLNGREQADEVE